MASVYMSADSSVWVDSECIFIPQPSCNCRVLCHTGSSCIWSQACCCTRCPWLCSGLWAPSPGSLWSLMLSASCSSQLPSSSMASSSPEVSLLGYILYHQHGSGSTFRPLYHQPFDLSTCSSIQPIQPCFVISTIQLFVISAFQFVISTLQFVSSSFQP